jgi:hypothetical protein
MESKREGVGLGRKWAERDLKPPRAGHDTAHGCQARRPFGAVADAKRKPTGTVRADRQLVTPTDP